MLRRATCLGGRPIPPASATNEHIIHQRESIIWYDDDLRLPLWVAYELTSDHASANLSRKNCLRKDPRLADAIGSVLTVDTWCLALI